MKKNSIKVVAFMLLALNSLCIGGMYSYYSRVRQQAKSAKRAKEAKETWDRASSDLSVELKKPKMQDFWDTIKSWWNKPSEAVVSEQKFQSRVERPNAYTIEIEKPIPGSTAGSRYTKIVYPKSTEEPEKTMVGGRLVVPTPAEKIQADLQNLENKEAALKEKIAHIETERKQAMTQRRSAFYTNLPSYNKTLAAANRELFSVQRELGYQVSSLPSPTPNEIIQLEQRRKALENQLAQQEKRRQEALQSDFWKAKNNILFYEEPIKNTEAELASIRRRLNE